MKGIAFSFFALAAVFVTLGMLWGIQMAISDNHRLAGAHAHLNLVGWVTMALFGIYYALTPQAADTGLAKLHFAVSTLGVVVFIPGIALTILDRTDAIVAIGSLITLAGMVLFLFIVLRHGLGRAA